MSDLLQISFAALGLTELCCFFLIAPLLHPRHAAVYHWSGTAASLFVPVFLDLLLVWVLMATLLVSVQARRLPWILVWLAFLLLAPAIVSYNYDLMFNGAARPLTLWLLLLSVLAGPVLLCGRSLWRWPLGRFADFASALTLCFGIGGALVLAQVAWVGWQARGLNRQPTVQSSREPTPHLAPQHTSQAGVNNRVIWIIFDELSYQQVYERRYPGLALPAFDKLAVEANVFTHTVPAGVFTDVVLPSLLSGRRLDRIRSSPGGALWTHDPDRDLWQAFNPSDTVFDDARQSGYRTFVAGWYIPYCRLLPDVLDGCFWSYDIPIKTRMSSQRDLLGNAVAPLLSAVTGWMPRRWLAGSARLQAFQAVGTQMHIEDYESISAAADVLLRDRSATFVLLHLPVPHMGGIYDRASGQLTTGRSTYLDNLSLADKCLAHLREVLEQTGQWDSSTVVVMGDHGWRMKQIVPDSAALTGEEQEASQGGRYDPRPVYVVKLAGQQTGVQVDTPFSAVHTRMLLDDLLRGELRTTEALGVDVQRLH